MSPNVLVVLAHCILNDVGPCILVVGPVFGYCGTLYSGCCGPCIQDGVGPCILVSVDPCTSSGCGLHVFWLVWIPVFRLVRGPCILDGLSPCILDLVGTRSEWRGPLYYRTMFG